MATDPQAWLRDVVRRLAACPQVAAIAVVGSTAAGHAGPDSDIDVFVYAEGALKEVRAQMAVELADPGQWQSVGETAFGDGDVWRLRDAGPWLDLMYWSPAWAEDQLRRVLVEHTASMGYSTAFWRSIRDAQPLYERGAWHPMLQQQALRPYPEELRHNIVALNLPYLRDHPFSFRHQVAKAIWRGDLTSVNHRLAAWLASYVDIVFAVNRVLHPGEKQVLEFVQRECHYIPIGLLTDVPQILQGAARPTPQLLEDMDALVNDLEMLLGEQRLLAL